MNNNNKQLKFNSGIYKGKTYKEISGDIEELNNIFKNDSPGYNKFKVWYNNNLDNEEKKYEPEKRIRINNFIESNDAYELRLINKKVHGTGLITLNYSSKINNDMDLRNLNFIENLLYDIVNNVKSSIPNLNPNSNIQFSAYGPELIRDKYTKSLKLNNYVEGINKMVEYFGSVLQSDEKLQDRTPILM